jgi:chromosomal replication initiator protein
VTPTFENYAGRHHDRAYAAALNVANHRSAHNPLFLVGPTASGKTHLLRSIEHAMRGSRVLRTSAFALADDLVRAFRSDQVAAFRESLMTLDVLLVDDFLHHPRHPLIEREIFDFLESAIDRGTKVVIVADEALVARWRKVMRIRGRVVKTQAGWKPAERPPGRRRSTAI